MFLKIVQMCRDTGEPVFNYAVVDCTGQPSIPLELKVLSALRILACGLKFDDAADIMQHISSTSVASFFKSFNQLFRLHYSHVHIRPLEGEELVSAMKVYAKLGLPGAAGLINTI